MSRCIKKALKTSIIHIDRHQGDCGKRSIIIGPANLEIPDFPSQKTVTSIPSLLFNNFGELMYCGDKICWVLRDGEWKIHSEFLEERSCRVMVQMFNGIYAFGGWNRSREYSGSESTSEFLPNNSVQWQPGPSLPYETRVMMKSGLAISKNELLLIGGCDFPGAIGKILKFNTNTSKWTVVGDLEEPRSECLVAIFNDKIIICNGRNGNKFLKSTEIIPFKVLESPSGESEIEFLPIRKGGDTKFARRSGGIGVVQVGGSKKLIKYGSGLPTQEWNDETETWHITTKIKSYKMCDTTFISKGTHYFH